MILGIGVDLLNILRIEDLYSKFGDKFARRILSDEELKNFNKSTNKINFLAKRFCAKEAFSKAIGTGIGRGVDFVDITIANNILGKPIILMSDKGFSFLEEIFKKDIKNMQFDISITDEKPYVNCFVIISYN